MTTKKLLHNLLSQPSVTPDDAGCMQILIDYLSSHGFEIHKKTFGEVVNLWACYGKGKPLTVFAGHVDVVPPGDDNLWHTPAFTPTEKDGYLYARGAADMKAGVAAMCVAAVEYVQKHAHFSGSIAIMLTADEEGPAQDGIKKLMPYLINRGVKIDYAVFGEPSSVNQLGDVIKNGRRGSMNVDLTVIGKQGHVAYPNAAANPIHPTGPIITALSREVWCQGNNSFPATSTQIWQLAGGIGASNVIPAEAKLNLNFRFSNELTAEKIQQRVKDIVQSELAKEKEITGKVFDYKINFTITGEPFLTPKGTLVDAMQKACQDVLGITPELSTSGGTSDARFVAPFGIQVVEFGPINATIHQANECVKIDDLEPLKNTYIRLLEKLYE